jgi:hypothetical protein
MEAVEDGRDRDRTDDLYRVNYGAVVYLVGSSSFILRGRASLCLVFGS